MRVMGKIKELVDRIPEAVFFFSKWKLAGWEGMIAAISVFSVYLSLSCISFSLNTGISGVWIFQFVPSLLVVYFAMGISRTIDVSDVIAVRKATVGLLVAIGVFLIAVYKVGQLKDMICPLIRCT